MLGKPIPIKMRMTMSEDPGMKICMRNALLNDHECQADPLNRKLIDWEHALTFAGSKINEPWAIISICWLVHRGGRLSKEINVWIALNRATEEELRAKSKSISYLNMRERLNGIYGVPPKTFTIEGPKLEIKDIKINYE